MLLAIIHTAGSLNTYSVIAKRNCERYWFAKTCSFIGGYQGFLPCWAEYQLVREFQIRHFRGKQERIASSEN